MPAEIGPRPISLRNTVKLAAAMQAHWDILMTGHSAANHRAAWFRSMEAHFTDLLALLPPVVTHNGHMRAQAAVTTLLSITRILTVHRDLLATYATQIESAGVNPIPLRTSGGLVTALTPPLTKLRMGPTWADRTAGLAVACAMNRMRFQAVTDSSVNLNDGIHACMFAVMADESLACERALHALLVAEVGKGGYGYDSEDEWICRRALMQARFALEDTLEYAGILDDSELSVSALPSILHPDIVVYRFPTPHGGILPESTLYPMNAPANGSTVWVGGMEHGALLRGKLVGWDHFSRGASAEQHHWFVDLGAPYFTSANSYQVVAARTNQLILKDPHESDGFAQVDVAKLKDILTCATGQNSLWARSLAAGSVSSMIAAARQVGWTPGIVDAEYRNNPETWIASRLIIGQPQRTNGPF